MLSIFDTIDRLKRFLQDRIEEGSIVKAHVELKQDFRILATIVAEQKGIIDYKTLFSQPYVTIQEITRTEWERSDYYRAILRFDEPLRVGLRDRFRFTSLLEPTLGETPANPCPVVTFYSYKGGMGRSTTMAAFATYCARVEGKKVVVIDGDFEAPGSLPFYGLPEGELARKNGLIEYLIDRKTGLRPSLRDYYSFEVPNDITGRGQIHLIKAGNLSLPYDYMNQATFGGDTGYHHLRDFLEGVSRLDWSNPPSMTDDFRSVLRDVHTELKPDLILWDCRPGFSDLLGLLGFEISDVIVGFFGNHAHTRPGLYFFLETLLKLRNKGRKIDFALVNSIISNRSLFRQFQYNVKDNTEKIAGQLGFSSIPALNNRIFALRRYVELELLGTEFDSADNFISIVEEHRRYYDELFPCILEMVGTRPSEEARMPVNVNLNYGGGYGGGTAPTPRQQPAYSQQQQQNYRPAYSTANPPPNNGGSGNMGGGSGGYAPRTHNPNYAVGTVIPVRPPIRMRELRATILEKLIRYLPEYRPKRTTCGDLLLGAHFFYRKNMEELVNPRKFLFVGSKGTGKTLMYDAMAEKIFTERLVQVTGRDRDHTEYHFVRAVREGDGATRFVHLTERFFEWKENDPERFYRRFWMFFTWSALRQEVPTEWYEGSLMPFTIEDTAECERKIGEYLDDNDTFNAIEREIREMDTALKEKNKVVVIGFDGLDRVVNPRAQDWNTEVGPLIEWWRYETFSNIQPKLFLRRDLFEKMDHMTNRIELSTHIVALEWTCDEIYSYLFKILFRHAQQEFMTVVEEHFAEMPHKFGIVNELKDMLAQSLDYQLPADVMFMRPLTEVFFGKFVGDMYNNHGECYDWLNLNLSDANSNLSLRPFLSMVENACKDSLNGNAEVFVNQQALRPFTSDKRFTILTYIYFVNEVTRSKAAEDHVAELASDPGFHALQYILNYIRYDAPPNLRVRYLKKFELDEILREVLLRHPADLLEVDEQWPEVRKMDFLRGILFQSGIMTQQGDGHFLRYVIPFLFKDYLGLRDVYKEKK